MKLVIDEIGMTEPQWFTLDMEGYEENVDLPEEEQISVRIRPGTRETFQLAGKNLKGKKQAEAFTRNLAKKLVVDWKNVEIKTKDGQVFTECNDFAKLLAFQNLEFAAWVIDKSKNLGFGLEAQREEEEKN